MPLEGFKLNSLTPNPQKASIYDTALKLGQKLLKIRSCRVIWDNYSKQINF